MSVAGIGIAGKPVTATTPERPPAHSPLDEGEAGETQERDCRASPCLKREADDGRHGPDHEEDDPAILVVASLQLSCGGALSYREDRPARRRCRRCRRSAQGAFRIIAQSSAHGLSRDYPMMNTATIADWRGASVSRKKAIPSSIA